jgi:ferritin-like metal-binding protein YciE
LVLGAGVRSFSATGANLLGRADAAKPLGKTLKEEYSADAKLTKIAESHLNQEAVQ